MTSYIHLADIIASFASIAFVSMANATTPRYWFDEAFRNAVFSYCRGAPHSVTHTQQSGSEAVYNITCGYSAFDTKIIIIFCESMPARNGGRVYICR
jgi:hypothetical protein